MKPITSFTVRRLAVLALAAAAVTGAAAQTRQLAVKPLPSAPAGAATAGQPAAAGLSATRSTTNASSAFPAGLPSNQPFPAGLPSVTAPNLSAGAPTLPGTPITGTAAATTPTAIDPTTGALVTATSATSRAGGSTANNNANNTAVSGGPGAPSGNRAGVGAGGSGYTAQQIAASFLGADRNRDGELTPGEAARLTIAPYTFEQMDANHDGIVTRFEYEDGVR